MTVIIDWGEKDREYKKNYFSALRMLVEEISDELKAKYNIKNIDIDDLPRVNIDFPKK